MRAFVIAAAITAFMAIGGVIGWQAKAAAPAGVIPHAAAHTPIHLAACDGTTGKDGCGPGSYYRKGAQGSRCYPC